LPLNDSITIHHSEKKEKVLALTTFCKTADIFRLMRQEANAFCLFFHYTDISGDKTTIVKLQKNIDRKKLMPAYYCNSKYSGRQPEKTM